MAGPGDDHQATITGESILDALPGPLIDEQAVPQHRGRSFALDAYGQ
jgi:hypothetical protein